MIEYLSNPYWRYGIWEQEELSMPRLVDEMLNCVIYLYPGIDEARASKNVGGSGFIVGVVSKADSSKFMPYAVTNAHVVNGGNAIIRLNNRDGTFGYIVKGDKDWIRSPDSDIAVTPLYDEINGADQKKHKIDFFVSDIMFADKQTVADDDIGIGDEAFIVGRFQLSDGKLQNTPALRWGTIAQMPIEEIVVNGRKAKVYLVECHSISGFSGSPVFVYLDYGVVRPKRDSVSPGMMNTYFLGVDCGHLPIKEKVYDRLLAKNGKSWELVVNDGLKVLSNSAMMAVAPAWKLRELLDVKEFADVRKTSDEELKKKAKNTPVEEQVIPDNLEVDELDFKTVLKKVSRKTTDSDIIDKNKHK